MTPPDKVKPQALKPGDKVRAVDSPNQQYTVIAIGTDVTLKGGLADEPFKIEGTTTAFEPVPTTAETSSRSSPPPPPKRDVGPMPKAPAKWETKWDKMKREMKLTDSEISAMQAYTTSTYAWINGFLRKGDGLEADTKRQIISWLVNTGVIGQLQRADKDFDAMLTKLIILEDDKQKTLENKWSAASPVLTRLIDLIVAGMSKWPQPKEEVVTRGVGLDKAPQFLKKMHNEEKNFSDPGFMSTTFSQPFAKDSLIVIKLPEIHPGRNIADISKFEQEAEILFPPGSGYSVDRILNKDNPADKAEFDYILKQLVASDEERSGRFGVVQSVYVGAFTPPVTPANKIKQTQSAFPAKELGPVTGRPCPTPISQQTTPPVQTESIQPTPQVVIPPPIIAPAKKEEEKKKAWIEIMLVDMEGKPVPGVRYRITQPGGEITEGNLNQFGQAGVYQIDPGNCKITFPELDGEAWEGF
jgi:hypothetical protein